MAPRADCWLRQLYAVQIQNLPLPSFQAGTPKRRKKSPAANPIPAGDLSAAVKGLSYYTMFSRKDEPFPRPGAAGKKIKMSKKKEGFFLLPALTPLCKQNTLKTKRNFVSSPQPFSADSALF